MLANQTNNTLIEPFNPLIVYDTFVLDRYINRAVGCFGILVNLLFVILLSDKKLKHKIYDFFWCRQFTSLIACLPIAASNGNCFDCEQKFEWLAYFYWFTSLTIRAFSLASFISDIFLISTRYFDMIRKETFLNHLSKKFNIFICLFTVFIISSPAYFAAYAVQTPSKKAYKLKFNDFGLSIYFRFYAFFMFFIGILIPLLIFLFLNIVSIIRFKILMDTHENLTDSQKKVKVTKYRFIKTVLLLSLITLTTRFIDLVTSTLNRIGSLFPSTFDQRTFELITFSKSCSFFFVSISLAFDALIYMRTDKNVWNLIQAIIRKKNIVS